MAACSETRSASQGTPRVAGMSRAAAYGVTVAAACSYSSVKILRSVRFAALQDRLNCTELGHRRTAGAPNFRAVGATTGRERPTSVQLASAQLRSAGVEPKDRPSAEFV